MIPKEKEFNLKKFKLTDKKGTHVEWSYMFSKGNAGHEDSAKIDRTLIPHKQLLDRLKLMKDMVLRCEEIDYAKNIGKIPGIKLSKEVEQAIEGSIINLSSKIEVTGFTISGKNDKRNVVITYKKISGNKKVAGRSTTAILLKGNIYGFEEELEELIEELHREVYAYLYKDKYSDMEQTSFPEEFYKGAAADKKPDKKKEEPKKTESKKPEKQPKATKEEKAKKPEKEAAPTT